MKIYLNGDLVAKEDAKISVFDHGLLYGDGVFEGIRLYDGCVFKLEEHLERSGIFCKSNSFRFASQPGANEQSGL